MTMKTINVEAGEDPLRKAYAAAKDHPKGRVTLGSSSKGSSITVSDAPPYIETDERKELLGSERYDFRIG